MATLQPKEQPTELELTGAGAERVVIPEIDQLAAEYIDRRDKRMKQLQDEIATKQKLIDAMHGYSDKIKLPNGDLAYHYGDTVIRLTPGKEKLKVEPLENNEEE